MKSVDRSSYLCSRTIRILTVLAVVASSIWVSSDNTNAENWTSLRGDRTVQARMVGMWGEQVVLVLSNGRQVSVHIDSLDAESRIQAKKLAVTLEQQREALSRELRGAAEAEAAPAPDPLPQPPAAEPYSPPSPNLKPDEAITMIQDQLAAGHLVVLYDALPLKFRNDVDGLAALLMRKLEPASWNDSMTQLHRLADLLVTRQNWILSYPHLLQDPTQSTAPNQMGEIFQKLILPAAGLIRAGLPPEATAPDAIISSGFGTWLRQRDDVIAPYLSPMMQKYGSPKHSWTLLGDTGEQTILQASGQPTASGAISKLSVAMKKVDGYWIPASLADGFSDWVTMQTTELEKFEDGTMSISAWLGGQSIGMNSLANAAPNMGAMGSEEGYGNDYAGEDQYAQGMVEQEMAMSESYDDGSSYGNESPYGFGGGPQGKAAEFAPPAMTGETIGTVVQSLSSLGRLISPLESAADKATFHQSMQQVISPIAGMIDMLGR